MSILTAAAVSMEAEGAAQLVALALRMEVAEFGTIPDETDWRRAGEIERLGWISAWLLVATQREARRLAGVPLPYSPIGGEKYANQND